MRSQCGIDQGQASLPKFESSFQGFREAAGRAGFGMIRFLSIVKSKNQGVQRTQLPSSFKPLSWLFSG